MELLQPADVLLERVDGSRRLWVEFEVSRADPVANHAKFAFTVTGREAKSLAGLVDFNKTETETVDSEGTTKTTSIRLEGTNHKATARTLVPGGADLESVTYQDDLTNHVTVLTFTETKNKKLKKGGGSGGGDIKVEETIEVSPPLNRKEYPTIMGSDPFKLVGGLEPSMVRISGFAEATSDTNIGGPWFPPRGIKLADIDSQFVSLPVVVRESATKKALVWRRTWNVTARFVGPAPTEIVPRRKINRIFGV